MSRISRIALVVAALLPVTSFAQTISGVVKDVKGNAVAGASVRIDGTNISTQTDEQGQFILQQIGAGEREVHISAIGYSHLHTDVTLNDGQSLQLELTLKGSPIEVIDVVATPMHMSVMESATPVNVIGGESLRRQQAATLGDTLEKQAGVHTSFHANVASTPIIRGLSGPRVLIAQNGLDVGDVSRVGPDHAVASEASTAEQIEVLRGPATLFYGSGAIGGVVNVVDSRVPTDSTTRGEWQFDTSSVNNQQQASFNVTTGSDKIALYADGFYRDSGNYEVPVEPVVETEEHEEEHHEEHSFEVENSGETSNGFTLGASYLMNNGYVGFSVEQFNREYGVPGHGDDHGEESDSEAELHDEEAVYADLEQTRIQVLSELDFSGEWLRKLTMKAALTDYQHKEIEAGEVGTVFDSSMQEFKADIIHNPLYGWNGGVSLHYKATDFEAQGEEAFTPPSESSMLALAIMEEKHFGDVLMQLGARIERVNISSPLVAIPDIEVHGEEEHALEEVHEEHTEAFYSIDKDFTPISLSAGWVWDFAPGYNVALSLSRSERAPSAAELLSFGPHIATGTYEVGALFELHVEADETHLELAEHDIEIETANNIDLTFRKTQGDVAVVLNAFYNQVDNYYYQSATGLYAEAGHEEEGEDVHDHAAELPVYLFRTDDVVLSGFEAQVAWQMTNHVNVRVFADSVRARLKDGGDLPRTPPLRFGTQLSYQAEQLSSYLDVTHYNSQDKIASQETETDGYTLVDLSVSYDVSVLEQDWVIYAKASNLTDTEARVHSSFLKDVAPRPGRNITVGVRGYF